MLHAALRGLGAGFSRGLRGIAGPMSNAAGAYGLAAGGAARSITIAGPRALGATTQGAFYGGMAGAGYGAISGDTSVLGGAISGMGLGAIGARYGAAGVARRGGFAGGFGRGVVAQARRDYRGVALAANRGMNRVASSLGQGIAANRIYSGIRRGF